MLFFKKNHSIAIAVFLSICLIYSPFAYSIPLSKEKELSHEFLDTVMTYFDLVKDPLINDYVNRVGQRILAHMPPQPFTYRFFVIKEREYNAFAGPGGVIFVHSGLLAAMENEDELAGILSHEISHVSCRHLSERADRSAAIGLATLAGIAAGILLGVGGVGKATEALTIGTLAANQSVSLAYSRDDEMEADKVGIGYLEAAGYSGEGLLTMLRKMRNKQWYGPNQIPTYLTTHPALEERLVYIGSRVENERLDSQNGTADTSPKKSNDFNWMHTKLVAMYGEEDAALQQFSNEVANTPEDVFAHYGYGLILARTAHLKDAAVQLKIALAKDAFNTNIVKDLGWVYFLDGQYKEALKLLSSAVSFVPDDPEARLYLGRTQIALGDYEGAVSTLKPIPSISDLYTEAYYYLGEALEKQGKMSTAYYYLGTYYKMIRNLRNAMFHLQRALESSKDPAEREKIKEMIAEVRGKFEEQRRQNAR